jgi:two-component system, cell cycle sensor histidine kinase and response regulator CckA
VRFQLPEAIDLANTAPVPRDMPVLRWLARASWAVGVLAVIIVFGHVVLPIFSDEPRGEIVQLVVMVLLLAGTGLLGWILWRAQLFAKQEILLREAFHGVLTPQLITDATGQLVLSNRAFDGWVDIGQNNAENILATRFADKDQATTAFMQMSQNARAGQVAVAELPVLRNKRIVEWRRVTVRQLTGWPGYLQWRLEDISERRRMERAMREEQAKLLDFMTNAPVGIYSVDQHGRFRFVNRTLAEWLGCGAEDLVHNGVRLHEVIVNPHKDIPPYAYAADHLAAPGGQHGGEIMMRSRVGTAFPVAIAQTVVTNEDGTTLRTRSIVRDLRPEREWQFALNVSEQRFERLFAQAPIGVVLLDQTLRLIECNKSLQQMLRRDRADLIDTHFTALLRPDDRSATLQHLQDALAGKAMPRPIELHLIGERHVIALSYIKQFNTVGKAASAPPAHHAEQANAEQPNGLVLYFIDISEQKKMEFQFAQSQKMQAIGQLAGGIAHDFNNLLTAMIGFCDLLLQRHKPGDQSFADIMQIKQNGNRAANLVRQLLAFSRQQTLQPKLLNLVDVLAELSNLLRRLIGADIRLEMVHGRDLPPVLVDQGQLEQVITNLVVNARDAMPQGGTVSVRTSTHQQDKPIIRGQDEMPAGAYVVIEVTDVGTGIPPEIIQRIFEPFFSTKEVGQGTGLGLSTVYGIVRQTGGFVDVQSVIGQGTKFIIYLPAHKPDTTTIKTIDPEEAREKSTADLTGAGTILLVEDEDAVRVFSSRALRNKGYIVLEARNGEEALSVMAKDGARVELLISDVVMPQMDGPTMIAKLRTDWPTLKVIFISGYTEDKFRDQLKAGEVVHFLGKPFTLKQLAGKVKDVLASEQ